MSGPGPWTERLADFIAGTSGNRIPAPARRAAEPVIADTVGVMLAGRRSDAGQTALRYLDSTGTQALPHARWVAGSPHGSTAETAALVNGTLGHGLDYDDTFPGAGHQAVVVLSSALAAATPGQPVSGRALVEAFVVGFEVSATVARAVGIGHYYKGWHMNCTAGTFGATAAACRMLGLDRPRTLAALGLAGSLASGLQRNSGTMTKPMHSGFAARNGVLAAQLASLGATAAVNVLDGPRGFFDVYGEGVSAPERLDLLGRPFALVDPGTALKKYPCCYIAARPLDALFTLLRAHDVTADDVAQIVCRTPVRALHAMIYSDPATGLEGKFCTEYILAAGLVDGHVSLSTFTDEAVRRPEVRAVMKRVTTEEDPDLRPEDPHAETSGPANGGRMEVILRCHDGREFKASESEPHGGPRNPFSWSDIEAKFLDCASYGGYAEAAARRLFGQLTRLEDTDDVLGPLWAVSGSLATDASDRPAGTASGSAG